MSDSTSATSPSEPTIISIPRTIGPEGPTEEQQGQIQTFARRIRKLVPGLDKELSLLEEVLRKGVVESEPTNAPTAAGTKGLPFNYDAAVRMKLHNVHHSTCVDAKKNALVGLGHVDGSKADEVLDPICTVTWAVLRHKLAEDFANVEICYIEVVRDPSDKIVGLHHLPAGDVRYVVEQDLKNHYYEIRGGKVESLASATNSTVMAPFGKLKEFKARHKITSRSISEVIAIMNPSSASRYYAVPSWLAAVADMELNQAARQHLFDFHVNRGVPEFLLFLTGGRVDTKTWGAIVDAMQAYVGVGNSHKSSAFNITGEGIQVNLQQLQSNDVIKGDFYTKMTEALATTIVSAHRVPPILAGILIPGKMGAANELPNAIMAFQTLVIGPWHTIWTSILGATLGGKFNGGLGLTAKDFEFKSIVDAMADGLQKLNPQKGAADGAANTVSGMRETLPEAAANGRDTNDGLKKRSRAARITALLTELLGDE
jgi:hypothetical protein